MYAKVRRYGDDVDDVDGDDGDDDDDDGEGDEDDDDARSAAVFVATSDECRGFAARGARSMHAPHDEVLVPLHNGQQARRTTSMAAANMCDS